MKTIIYFLLTGLISCLLISPSSTNGQKVSTEDFLKTHDVNDPSYAHTFPEILAKCPPISLPFGEYYKRELSEKSPIVVLSDSAVSYPTPFILFSLEEVKGDFIVDCKGYGTPWGLKKIIMFPYITVYDQDGNLHNLVYLLEYDQKTGVTEPDYVLMRINIKVDRPGKLYLLVSSINLEAMKKFIIFQNGPYGKIAIRAKIAE